MGARLGGRRAPTLMDRVWAPGLDSFASIFYIFQKYSPLIFRSFREILVMHKITPWQFYGKQRQFGLVPFKSCKLESKTRATVFGKVDTLETYQLPKLKPLLVLKQFS